MTGTLHPALAPLLAGGGTPERLAARSDELRHRMERLLWLPLPLALDAAILAPLTTPPRPGDPLEEVLARLAGGVADAGEWGTIERPRAIAPDGSPPAAAPRPMVADIIAHARAMMVPPVRASRPHEALSLVVAPDVQRRARRAWPVADRDWQVEAVQLGKDRPVTIVTEPLASPGDPRRPEPRTGGRPIGAFPVGEQSTAGRPFASPAPNVSEYPSADAADAISGAARQRAVDGPLVAPSLRRAGPGMAGATRQALRQPLTNEPTPNRPMPRLVTVADGARIGGFAGLAALGRPASSEAAPADLPLPEAPTRQGEFTPSIATGTAIDGAFPPDAKAVIAELADVLRLQILAAGIDLSGRPR